MAADRTRPDLISAVVQVKPNRVKSILRGQGPNYDVRELVNRVVTQTAVPREPRTNTALLEACRRACEFSVVRPTYTFNNRPPLDEPARKAKVEKFLRIVHLLLDHGADPKITGTSQEGGTYVPFHFAVASGNLALMEMLLNAKAEVNQTDHKGQSALHMYVKHKGFEENHSKVLSTLILKYQADVNLQDKRGKTPLRLSSGNLDDNLNLALLQNGALATLASHSGKFPLGMAGMRCSSKFQEMVDLCLAEPRERPELIIKALECIPLSVTKRFDWMRKEAQLRVKHNIAKKPLEPMECYGFVKEWATIEELEAYRGDKPGLKLQTVLARERLHQGNIVKLRKLIDAELISDVLKASKSEAGKLLERHLQLRGTMSEKEILELVMKAWSKEIEENFESFGTNVVVKVMKLAIKRLTALTDGSDDFDVILSTIITLLISLYSRNRRLDDTSKDERSLAQELMDELIDEVPMACCGDNVEHDIPIQHIITEVSFSGLCRSYVKMKFTETYVYDLMKMLLESGKFKVNTVDMRGYTLLHSAVESAFQSSIPAIKLLLEKGVYPNARNHFHETAREVIKMKKGDQALEIRNLLQQYEDRYSMTLLTKAALAVTEFDLPYEAFLKAYCPGIADVLISFVHLHGGAYENISNYSHDSNFYNTQSLESDNAESDEAE